MQLVLARHGETDWNSGQRIQGQADIPLNAVGRAQAITLAERLEGLGIAHVYASDLARAYETADIVARHLRVPLLKDERLRECSFGSLDGQTYAEIRLHDAQYPHNSPRWHDPMACDFRPWGGEHGQRLYTRQLLAISDIHDAHRDATVLVVGHGRSLRTLLFGLGHEIVYFGNCQHHQISFDPSASHV